MKPIIEINHLSKKYRYGESQSYYTLRDSLTNFAKHPFGIGRENVGLKKGEFWALKDISFKVNQGEAVGVIGPNGAGKSTLLKILSRITPPTSGDAILRGRVGSLLEVGTGFQQELTGRENIYLNGAILGMKRAEINKKFDEIVDFSGVEKFLDTPVKHYSSGMYMRLAFAVAANLDSDILIVDEVLAVGDSEFQKKCLGKMGDITKNEGRTVLFVSHNMNAVEELCEKVIILQKGTIEDISNDVSLSISNYLNRSFSNENNTSEWINNEGNYKNSWFYPTKLSLVYKNTGMTVKSSFNNNEETCVAVEAEIEELDSSLTVGYALYDSDFNLIYWSYQTDSDESEWPKLKIGHVKLMSDFPTRLLNEGEYYLFLNGGLHCRQGFFDPPTNAPCIRFGIRGGLSDSPLWILKRPGIVAPVIKWRKE